MTKNDQEVAIGFHLIRKSASSLIEDLKYFNDTSGHFSTSQIINILGQIDEVEQSCKRVRKIFANNISSKLSLLS